MKKISTLLLISLFLALSCDNIKRNVYKKVFYRMDTVVELTLILEENASKMPFKKKTVSRADSIFRNIDSLLLSFEQRFSQNSQTSEILKLNRRKENSVSISDELYQMLVTGQAYGDTLNGDFDITLLPLKELWGFGKGEGRASKPVDSLIAKTLEYINYKSFSLKNTNSVQFTNSNTFIDCGGIAKGVAIEEMGNLLTKLNVKDYLIAAGGDILASGMRIDNTPWKLGIKHPRGSDKPLALFELTNGSVVTSGDYERFVEYNGVKFHHLFDVKTGYPANKNMSVTIYSKSPVIADIMSTGLFSRNAKDIISFVEKRSEIECVVVDSAGVVHISDGWKKKITLL